MKQAFLLLFIALVALSGCKVGPSIDQTSREHMNNEQENKKSDAFARSLSQ